MRGRQAGGKVRYQAKRLLSGGNWENRKEQQQQQNSSTSFLGDGGAPRKVSSITQAGSPEHRGDSQMSRLRALSAGLGKQREELGRTLFALFLRDGTASPHGAHTHTTTSTPQRLAFFLACDHNACGGESIYTSKASKQPRPCLSLTLLVRGQSLFLPSL
jgi:hypothetical protein